MGKKDRDAVNKGLEEVLASTDILGNVISRDRERFGRSDGDPAGVPQPNQGEDYDSNTSHTAILQYDKQTIPQSDKPADTQPDNQTHTDVIPQVLPQKPQPEKRKRREGGADVTHTSLTERVQRAAQMAKSPTTTVTLRIPAEMNEWLDEYVHRAWPTKIKKQDMVIEALQLLIARRAAVGEPIIPTNLLPEAQGSED